MPRFGVNRGQWRQIGGQGEWSDTRALLGYEGRIFASHGNGKLFSIDVASGAWTQLGDSSAWNTKLMFAVSGKILLVEHTGALWGVDPDSGAYEQLSPDGEWINIDCGDWTESAVYCHSREGTLWEYSPDRGWRQLGDSTGWTSRLVFSANGLLTIEQDDTVYRVDASSGAAEPIGKTTFRPTVGVGLDGNAFACFTDGGLWDLDIAQGGWSEIGTAKTWKSKALVTTGDDLVTLEETGTLFEIYL
jgi:hypothetical protein